MPIWSTDYLNRVSLEAEVEIAKKVPCIIDRYSLETRLGITEYRLPSYINNIRRVFWKGIRLDPYGISENFDLSNTGGIVSDGAFTSVGYGPAYNIDINTRTGESGSRPYGYYYSSFGENVIKFDPAVNESISTYPFGLYSTAIRDSVIIEFYRLPDGAAFRIPAYIRRRTIKAYVLWKAFLKEGDGQNLNAAQYWMNRYNTLLARADKIIKDVGAANLYTRSSEKTQNNVINRPKLPWAWDVVNVEDEE